MMGYPGTTSEPTPSDPPPPTIGASIRSLQTSVSELEGHIAEMNYPGTDEFSADMISRHPFDDGAYEVLHTLAGRVEQLSNDLYSAEQERRSFSGLNPREQSARVRELEQMADDVAADGPKP